MQKLATIFLILQVMLTCLSCSRYTLQAAIKGKQHTGLYNLPGVL